MANKVSLNVLKGTLAFHSSSPIIAFPRNGCCQVRAADVGNHSVADVYASPLLIFLANISPADVTK